MEAQNTVRKKLYFCILNFTAFRGCMVWQLDFVLLRSVATIGDPDVINIQKYK